ncbi:hypothetical protein [Blastomonas sp. AAP53]|uniref:hypothetical protein n=1 Tax=Blastomonas sp. AAP53 TaxID=1248760 RepID=UPI0003105215|nr:hypothetical protein [Blastomonas sp. AAP53]
MRELTPAETTEVSGGLFFIKRVILGLLLKPIVKHPAPPVKHPAPPRPPKHH